MSVQTLSRKEEILKISARLFKERGYSAVTMRDLANALGIKAASLYNHISSKQQILSEIVIAIARDFTEGMEEIVDAQISTQEKLQAIIRQHVTLTSRDPDGMAALNNDWMHLEEQLDTYLTLRSQYENFFREILRTGKNLGEIKNVPDEILLFSVLSTLRNLYIWIPKKADMDTDDLTQSLSEILLKGIVI